MTEQAPSKTDLLERWAERDLVREGKSVLEERRDLLAHQVLTQIDTVDDISDRRDRDLAQARRQFRLAATRHGVRGLRAFARDATTLPAPGWQTTNRLGVTWLKPTQEPLTAPAPELGADWEISLELEAATTSLQHLVQSLVALAVAESNLARLVAAFRRTQRRVSALEHVVLPDLEAAIHRIEDALEELERDDLARALLIKRRQGRHRPDDRNSSDRGQPP